MSLETSTNAIRDYCVEAVKTAWPGVTVSHEPAEIRDTPPIARVNMLEPQIGEIFPAQVWELMLVVCNLRLLGDSPK